MTSSTSTTAVSPTTTVSTTTTTYGFDPTNGLQNYWPINSDVADKVSNANMCDGVNFSFTLDRFNRSNQAIDLNNGFYRLPTGSYICGDFTFALWAFFRDQTTKGNRILDIGNEDSKTSDDALIFVYSAGNNQNNPGFIVFNGNKNATSSTNNSTSNNNNNGCVYFNNNMSYSGNNSGGLNNCANCSNNMANMNGSALNNCANCNFNQTYNNNSTFFSNCPNCMNNMTYYNNNSMNNCNFNNNNSPDFENNQPVKSSKSITFGTWDHYVFTLSGTNARIYINGVEVANTAANLPKCLNRTSIYVGKSNVVNDNTPNANAIFDEMRLYNRALSLAEIQSLMNLAE
jgi:hypothetical protein